MWRRYGSICLPVFQNKFSGKMFTSWAVKQNCRFEEKILNLFHFNFYFLWNYISKKWGGGKVMISRVCSESTFIPSEVMSCFVLISSLQKNGNIPSCSFASSCIPVMQVRSQVFGCLRSRVYDVAAKPGFSWTAGKYKYVAQSIGKF